MLVLDEQLLGRGLETVLGRWYHGPILFITELRPNTIIKDEAIPTLLHQQHSATFITINESDFWRRVVMARHYCVICFALPDSQVSELPALLRAVFRHPLFHTKAQRMGKVLRVTRTTISYYSLRERQVQSVALQ